MGGREPRHRARCRGGTRPATRAPGPRSAARKGGRGGARCAPEEPAAEISSTRLPGLPSACAHVEVRAGRGSVWIKPCPCVEEGTAEKTELQIQASCCCGGTVRERRDCSRNRVHARVWHGTGWNCAT